LWTLALMAALDIPVNVMTSIIPALLVIIGSTEDIHLLTEYRSASANRETKSRAFFVLARNMWLAVTLTFITTYLGFLSVSVGHLELLQQFGLVASTGLLFNFIITVLLIPAILKITNLRLSREVKVESLRFFQKLATRVFGLTKNYRSAVIGILMAITVVSVYFATQVQVNNNVMDYFDDESQLAVQAEKIHQKLSGIQSFSIILSGTDGTFLQVPYLHELWNLQDFLKDTGYFDSSYSFADFIGILHSGLDSEWQDLIYLPDRNEVVREYMSLLDQESARTFVSPDFSQARIFVGIISAHQ